MGITHSFVSTKSDGDDDTLVRPSDWNDDHAVTFIELPEIATPSTPTSGNARLFVGADGYLYLLASDGNEVPVSGIVGPGADFTVVGTMEAIGASPLTFTKPAGTADGDLLIIACQTTNSIPNAAGPDGSGWTNWFSFDTSSSEWQVIWWKIASSEASTWTLTHSAGSDVAAAGIVLRGVNAVWFLASNADSFQTPPCVGHPLGLHLLIWMMTTGGTVDIAAPVGAGITTDADVNSGAGNYSAVTIAHRPTHSSWDAFSMTARGRVAGGYGLAFAVVLYDDGT